MNNTAELLSVSKVLEKKIHQTANEIFDTYQDTFLKMEVSYVVSAVWGATKNGKLDETQKKIYNKANKLVEASLSAFITKDLAEPQAYAIRYLVNTTMIYCLSYLIEMRKNKLFQDQINTEKMLKNIKPPNLLS